MPPRSTAGFGLWIPHSHPFRFCDVRSWCSMNGSGEDRSSATVMGNCLDRVLEEMWRIDPNDSQWQKPKRCMHAECTHKTWRIGSSTSPTGATLTTLHSFGLVTGASDGILTHGRAGSK